MCFAAVIDSCNLDLFQGGLASSGIIDILLLLHSKGRGRVRSNNNRIKFVDAEDLYQEFQGRWIDTTI